MIGSLAQRAGRPAHDGNPRRPAHRLWAAFVTLGVSALIVLVGTGGCTFNVEEETETVTWLRELPGAARVVIDDEAFNESDISVEGADGDSLMLSCMLRRLVAAGDEGIDNLELRAARDNDTILLSLLTKGDDWILYELDKVEMRLARGLDLDVALVEGALDVSDFDGFVTASVSEGSVDIDTRQGCDVVVEAGDVAVRLVAAEDDPGLDSMFEKIDIEVSEGDVAIRVPPELRARLTLSATNGSISVLGEGVSGAEFEGTLNGGHPQRRIRCRVERGNVTLAHTQAF
ncbi:MAG: hypothetical protein GF331_12700 [Chitinivibrionales bacterium]|nr:hypothetical protein [Chitinivibrionales bacterium]